MKILVFSLKRVREYYNTGVHLSDDNRRYKVHNLKDKSGFIQSFVIENEITNNYIDSLSAKIESSNLSLKSLENRVDKYSNEIKKQEICNKILNEEIIDLTKELKKKDNEIAELKQVIERMNNADLYSVKKKKSFNIFRIFKK